MAGNKCCSCGGGVRLLFPCSGAADTGEISDRVARRLTLGGAGRMSCLAGVGGRVPFVMDKMPLADEIWAIDGCVEDCARRTLEAAGFVVARHVRVTDCGLEKGKSPVTEDSVAQVLGVIQA
ncbi:MAG: putative zinc-binding protein [Vicinamibacteria bacterium]|nr:putative zinc-binding protein [Vicinamibacteria bacterium]